MSGPCRPLDYAVSKTVVLRGGVVKPWPSRTIRTVVWTPHLHGGYSADCPSMVPK